MPKPIPGLGILDKAYGQVTPKYGPKIIIN